MTVAEALAARLRDHGVDTVFGLPGEENLAVVEAIGESDIELIVTRHEQHAAFMAAAHGRLTGRPGVCLATLGPGALNLFTGLAHAQLGGMPLIAITGQKPRRGNDEGSFQVVDVPAAAAPVTAWAVSVDDPARIGTIVDEAFERATRPRPGAVLIELPEDVAGERAARADAPVPEVPTPHPATDAVTEAAARIDAARHVVLLAGAATNTSNVAPAVTDFADRTGIGVLATQMGKGAIPETHDLSYRSLGIHRPDYSHLAFTGVDLVVTAGYQPVEHPPLAWNPDEDIPTVHVAPWPAAVEAGYRPELQVVGDLGTSLGAIAGAVRPRDAAEVAVIRSAIVRLLNAEDGDTDGRPSPLDVVRTVRQLLAPEDVVALDNGVYKIWFARHYPVTCPQSLLLDNALATMGAGLATGMEAARLTPQARTLVVCGDGGFMMNVQDLETAVRLDLALTVVVLRDDGYEFIGWHQDEQDRPRTGVTVTNPDIVGLAAAFGCNAHRVTGRHDLSTTLEAALDEPGVSVVDCPVDYAMNSLLSTDLYARAREALPPQ